MKHLTIILALTIGLASCTRTETYPLGTDVTVEKAGGGSVSGRLVEVKPDRIVVQGRDGLNTEVLKTQITSLKAMTPAAAPSPGAEATPATTPPATADATPPATAQPTALAPAPTPAASPSSAAHAPAGAASKTKPAPRGVDNSRAASAAAPADAPPAAVKEATPPPPPVPEYRELTIPSGTTLSATLATSLASDTSKVEDAVRATLKSPVSIEGFELLPSGTTIVGHVTSVQQSAKVKGRASIAFRFNSAHLHEGPEQFSSATIVQEAASTKGKDATKVGVGAGIGAVIGGIAGGGSGAAAGAAIGGGAGTATVLATRGDEVRIPAGTPVSVKLTAPLTIRVRVR